LQIAGVIADENFVPTNDSFNYYVKPNSCNINVHTSVFEILKFDFFAAHAKESIVYSEVGGLLNKWLSNITINYGVQRLTVVGKGVNGDLRRIFDNVFDRDQWHVHCQYQPIEFDSVASWLAKHGKLKLPRKTGLLSWCEYLGVPALAQHNAVTDAIMTLGCFEKLNEIKLQ